MDKITKQLWIVLLAVLVLSGCTTTLVSAKRSFVTGFEAEDAFAIILSQREICPSGEMCRPAPPLEEVENSYSGCLAGAMLSASAGLAIVHAEEFRRVAYAGMEPGALPIDGSDLLPLLREEAFRNRIAKLNLRYIIMLRPWTTHYGSKMTGNYSAPGAGYIGKESIRSTSLSATIVDVRNERVSGMLLAQSEGKSGFMVPLFGIVPLPPIPYSSPTDGAACQEMGVAIMDFLVQQTR